MPHIDPYTGKIEHESANPGFSLPYPTTDSLQQAKEAQIKDATQYQGGDALAKRALQAGQTDEAIAQAWRARHVAPKDSVDVGSWAKGGPIPGPKDPRASRRNYAKGGPIFR